MNSHWDSHQRSCNVKSIQNIYERANACFQIKYSEDIVWTINRLEVESLLLKMIVKSF